MNNIEKENYLLDTDDNDIEMSFDDKSASETSDGLKFVRGGTILAKCSPDYEGTLVIPEGVELLASSCFRHCYKIKEIEIPSTLNLIARDAFKYTQGIEKFIVNTNNDKFSTSPDGKILFFENNTIIVKATTDIEEYSIPETVQDIYAYAFHNCRNLKQITIPNSAQ